MQLRTFSQQVLLRKLANNGTSSNYTQSFSKVFETAPGCSRVVYILEGEASLNVAFTVTIATNASGASPTDLPVVTANVAHGIYTYEITPDDLTPTKQFVSAKVTVTSGTYGLIELRHALHRAGDLTAFYSTTWAGRQNSPSIP
jgi:hypothetical protein